MLLACGMFASTFAQPEISEKWVITPVPNMKGVLGRLDINFPPDVERNILIYQHTDNKFLTSVSRNDKIYSIAPGEYRFTLTNVPVDNVPIQKGHETRLKAGFLDIVSEGDWHLYDETKEKAYTSGNKPKKLPLPVGNYQIKLGGQFYPVIIKDGETVEDYSPVEVKNETPGQVSQEVIGADPITTQPIEQDKWEITQLPGSKEVTGKNEPGMLDMNFSGDTTWHMKITKTGYLDILLSADDFRNSGIKPSIMPSYDIAPGEYNIRFNNIQLQNVPIVSRNKTRIKTGLLKVNATYVIGEDSASLFDLLDFITLVYEEPYEPGVTPKYSQFQNFKGSASMALIEGKYGIWIPGDNVHQHLVINDRKTTRLDISLGVLKIINPYDWPWSLRKGGREIYNAYVARVGRYFALPVGSYTLHWPLPNGTPHHRTIQVTGYSYYLIGVD